MPSDICLYPIQMFSLKTRRPIFKLVIVHRGEPGYRPSKYRAFKSERAAWRFADGENMDMGVWTRDDVKEIVESSIRAQDVAQAVN